LLTLKETQMIKIQKIRKPFTLLLAAIGLFSCNDDDTTIAFEVTGDVFITKKMIAEEEQFAASYYAFGTHPITAAKVSSPNAEEFNLTAVNESPNTWIKVPEEDDFVNELPTLGTYTFTVTHESVEHETTDDLIYNDLKFTEIISKEFSSQILTLEWEAGPGAEGHIVRLVNETGDIVFGSAFIPEQGTKLEIGINTGTGTWLSGYPKTGDTYSIELHAFSFESGVADSQKPRHIQGIAVTDDSIIWE